MFAKLVRIRSRLYPMNKSIVLVPGKGGEDVSLQYITTSMPILRVIMSRVSPASGSIPAGAPQHRVMSSRVSIHQYHGHRFIPAPSATLALRIIHPIECGEYHGGRATGACTIKRTNIFSDPRKIPSKWRVRGRARLLRV